MTTKTTIQGNTGELEIDKTKIQGITRGGNPVGTSLGSYVRASYVRLVEILGEPQIKLTTNGSTAGDGKCSTEWLLTFKGETFTLYDYKETSL